MYFQEIKYKREKERLSDLSISIHGSYLDPDLNRLFKKKIIRQSGKS